MEADKKIKVGIVGAAGYTGGELLRLLIHHPQVEIVFAQSNSQAGKKIYEAHHDLLGDTEMEFAADSAGETDVIFLCLSHGEAKNVVPTLSTTARIIDLSHDFRWSDEKDFVYGLPELQKEKIISAKRIANPGCFATAIQLALLPLAADQLLTDTVTINAVTGSTGAGKSLADTSHFSQRVNNVSVYKAFNHQHLREINISLQQLQQASLPQINFIPQRGAFARGIFATTIIKTDKSLDYLQNLYETFYATHPFVQISPFNIDLKNVVNTNKCFIYLEKNEDQLMIVTAIDNLLKGASGQAVQNMNLMFGLAENTGLNLKAAAF